MPFIREFYIDPGDAILEDVASINIINNPPVGSIQGLVQNTVGIIGEFLKGPFATPTLEGSYASVKGDFGGYSSYLGDGDLSANGNGIAYLSGFTWGNIVVTRVNTEVGNVTYTLSAALASDYLIPAGSRVGDGTNTYITDQDLTIAAGQTTGTVGISPANAGTFTSLINSITHVIDTPAGLGTSTLSVSNAAATTALNISTAYTAAITATLVYDGSPGSLINILFSARKDPAASQPTSGTGTVEPIRAGLISNATTFALSAGARYAVTSVIRGTQKQAALYCKQSSQNSYGQSDEREFFEYICGKWLSPEANSTFELTPDVWMASILSQLPPWENPGQATPYTAGILGLESDLTAVYSVNDYITFEQNGINALINDPSGLGIIFDQGFTGVNQTAYSANKRISRIRMQDYITLSEAYGLAQFSKKLSTPARQDALVGELNTFLLTEQSPQNPELSHIAGYTLDAKSGNTDASLAQGLFTVIQSVKTYSSLDSINIRSTVGEGVVIVAAT